MNFRAPEILALGIAASSFAASSIWFGIIAGPPVAERQLTVTRKDPGVTHDREVQAWSPTISSWLPPNAQNRGKGWLYEVFTPPEIFYDVASKKFGATPPQTGLPSPNEHDAPVEPSVPIGLQLVTVQQRMFRLQLIGYAQTADTSVGLFENSVTGEIFLAAQGKALPLLGLTILDVEVITRPVGSPGATTTQQMQAAASVRDENTGETILLNSSERFLSPEPRAILSNQDVPPTHHDVGKGDVIGVEGLMYEVSDIQMSPPQVVIARPGTRGGTSERCILTVPAVEASGAITSSL